MLGDMIVGEGGVHIVLGDMIGGGGEVYTLCWVI